MKRALALKTIRPWCEAWFAEWVARGRPKDATPPYAATWLLQERWGDAQPGGPSPPATEPEFPPADPMEQTAPHEPWEVGDAATG
jgi:hypothetical protein